MKNLLLLVIFALLPQLNYGQSHSLLKNIGEGEEDGILVTNHATEWNGLTYFITGAPSAKNRIWSTDGTEENTVEVIKENYFGLTALTSIDSCLLFNGWPDEHRALYRYDGDNENIIKLAEFPNYSVDFLQRLNSTTALFITADFFQDSTFLWSTDGTEDGTILLGKYGIKPDFMELTYYKNSIIFSEKSTNLTAFPPVISDGTLEGTMLVTEFINAVTPVDDVEFAVGTEDFIFVKTATDGLVFDGSSTADFPFGGDYIHGFKLGHLNLVFSTYFVMVYDSIDGSSKSLSTDFGYFSTPISNGEKVFFHNEDDYVYETDGTDAGTKKISLETSGMSNFDPYLYSIGNKLYYSTRQAAGYQYREVDLVTNLDTLFSLYQPVTTFSIDPYMFNVGDQLLYAKNTMEEGRELWVYDNTATTGVRELIDAHQISISPNPSQSEVIITFDIDIPKNSSISVFNSLGQLVLNSTHQSMQWQLDVSKLNSGQYFLQLNVMNKFQYLGSFFKQ